MAEKTGCPSDLQQENTQKISDRTLKNIMFTDA
jgi:hypothetical protein